MAQWYPLVSGAFTSWAKSSEKEHCTFWASNSHTHTHTQMSGLTFQLGVRIASQINILLGS